MKKNCNILHLLQTLKTSKEEKKRWLESSPTSLIMENPFYVKLPQEHDSSTEAKTLYSSYVVTCVLNAVFSPVTIVLNSLTIHAIRKASSLPKSLKTLLLSLAASDLGVGLLVQPFYTTLLVKCLLQYNRPSYFNNVFIVLRQWFSLASFFGVTALSADRFLAIHLHLRYQELVTHKRVIAVAISIWLFSTFLSLLDVWIPFVASVVISIILILCFLSTTYFYCKIYLTVRRHRNQIQALQVRQVTLNDGVVMANSASLRRSAVGAFYVYFVFLVCYLPNYVNFVVKLLSEPNIDLEVLSLYTFTLVLFNSTVNPLIYFWKMRHIRRAVMDILRLNCQMGNEEN